MVSTLLYASDGSTGDESQAAVVKTLVWFWLHRLFSITDEPCHEISKMSRVVPNSGVNQMSSFSSGL